MKHLLLIALMVMGTADAGQIKKAVIPAKPEMYIYEFKCDKTEPFLSPTNFKFGYSSVFESVGLNINSNSGYVRLNEYEARELQKFLNEVLK